MIVAFEGIDKAGKSTMIDNLMGVSDSYRTTTLPNSDSLFGIDLRRVIFGHVNGVKRTTLNMLFLADNIEVQERFYPKSFDDILITDRSFITGVVYTGELNDGVPVGESLVYEKLCHQFIEKPDLVLLMTLTDSEIEERYNTELDDLENVGLDVVKKRQADYIAYLEQSGIDYVILTSSDVVSTVEFSINFKFVYPDRKMKHLGDQPWQL